MCLESIHLPTPARLSFTSFPRSQNSISSIQLTQQVQLLPLRTYLARSATILLRSQVLRHWGLRHVYFFYVCISQPTMKTYFIPLACLLWRCISLCKSKICKTMVLLSQTKSNQDSLGSIVTS